jgi:TolB-like protein
MLRLLSLSCLFFLSLGLVSGPVRAEQQPRVAVLELKGKLPRGQLAVLSDKVRSGVLAGLHGKDYVVMSRENMAMLIKDMGLDCESVQGECEVETGRNIGAAYVVSGSVEDVGSGLLLVSLKVHDTQSGALKATGDVRGKEVIQLIDQLPGTVAQVMARAFGEGGQQIPVVQAPPTPGTPAQAQFNLNFGSGGSGLGVQAKLKEQQCVRQADQNGSRARAQRLADAIAQAKSKASQAWRAQFSEVEMCTKLERSQRSGCISAVEQWLSVARSMRVELPAGVENIQTDCGARQPAYQSESRMVAADEVSQAESLLSRLKAADGLSGGFSTGGPYLSTGWDHGCVVLQSGSVRCWGGNAKGQTNVPRGAFQSIGGGSYHTCGLLQSGSAKCWGANNAGVYSVPTDEFKYVSGGSDHACGILRSGRVKCWGKNNKGQANNPSGEFQSISAGYLNTCGVTTSGTIKCWGDPSYGQTRPPRGVYKSVSVGLLNICGLLQSGRVKCWGVNASINTPPTSVFQDVSVGSGHVCGLLQSGEVKCWGKSDKGQLRRPSGAFLSISATGNFTCGVTTSGAVKCWGQNDKRQLNIPSGLRARTD